MRVETLRLLFPVKVENTGHKIADKPNAGAKMAREAATRVRAISAATTDDIPAISRRSSGGRETPDAREAASMAPACGSTWREVCRRTVVLACRLAIMRGDVSHHAVWCAT